MPATGRHYLIAGAGISGLTLALCLAKFGAKVSVLERSPTIQEFGAGLQISPNARFVLDQLGLGDALDQISLEPVALDVFRQGGRAPLVSMALGPLMRARFGSPYAVMHRADLANLLHVAARRFANIDIVLGVRDWSVSTSAKGVTVQYEDDAGSQSRVAEALVGADGVHSRTRQVLGGPQAQFGHRIAWRSLIDARRLSGLMATDRVSVFFGTGFHLVCYPLPHRGAVNLALFMPGETPDAAGQPKPLRPGPLVEAILDAAAKSWAPWPLYTVTTPIWSRDNIGLIGDAAHAMVPFQAQGAAMGIEDAATLAPLLVGTEPPAKAFERYAALRQSRVGRVAALSARNGRIFHLPWPLSMGRDLVMTLQAKHAHLRRLGWIYEHQAGTQGPV